VNGGDGFRDTTGFEWPFRGAVDEIRIYDRALNAAEVLRLDAGP
jgi:hypothetical protein